MYKVAKLAPSSQVASKRGLTTYLVLSLSSATASNFYTIIFLSKVFGCRKNGTRKPSKTFTQVKNTMVFIYVF